MDKQTILSKLQKKRDNYGKNFKSTATIEDVMDILIFSKELPDPFLISKKIDAIMKKLGFSQKEIDAITKRGVKNG